MAVGGAEDEGIAIALYLASGEVVSQDHKQCFTTQTVDPALGQGVGVCGGHWAEERNLTLTEAGD